MTRLPSVFAALLVLWMPLLRGFWPVSLQRHYRSTGFMGPRPSWAPVHSGAAALLEVEVKFRMTDQDPDVLRDRLRALGCAPRGTVRMVDWYFDSPGYALVRQDCWLRFRQRLIDGIGEGGDLGASGDWELKRGRRDGDQATVYEEIPGVRGFDVAMGLLPPPGEASAAPSSAAAETLSDELADSSIPALPRPDAGLVPFARIVTTRTSWTTSGPQPTDTGISIDLDTTEDGHAVGEIETIVATEAQVPQARVRLQDFLQRLLGAGQGSTAPAPAKGKLEAYIEKNRPDLYRILRDEGIM